MIKHTLLMAVRNIKKYKNSFFINFIGLSTGLACAILIFLWVNDEENVDAFHLNNPHLYQVRQNFQVSNGVKTAESTPGLLYQSLQEEIPEVQYAVAVAPPMDGGKTKGLAGNGNIKIKGSELFISEHFFEIFSFKLIEGSRKTPLRNKSDVLISEHLALKLFKSNKNLVGKEISWEHSSIPGNFTIAGVFVTPPSNSTLKFDLLFNYDLFFDKYQQRLMNWSNSVPSTFVLLKEGTDPEKVNGKLENFAREKYLAFQGKEGLQWVGTLFLQSFADKYLYNHFENGVQAGGRIQYVRLLAMIGIILLFIACINFMNLSTARASRRLKEVGIKKTVGASRFNLILQFIGESSLITLISLLGAISLVSILLPGFNSITDKNIMLVLNPSILILVIGLALAVGILAGSYPAFYLSGFRPIKVLKGDLVLRQISSALTALAVRRGLVILQFIISVILITSVIVIHLQISYINKKNLGYSKENIIQFSNEGGIVNKYTSFIDRAKKIPGVAAVSSFENNFTNDHGLTASIEWEGKNPKTKIDFANMNPDYGLMELMGLELEEGRFFSEQYADENETIIFNHTAIKAMNLDNPIGKIVRLWGTEREIIGVVKDFHFESLYQNVKPCFFIHYPDGNYILAKMKSGLEQETIAAIEALYKEYNPGIPFEFNFLDQQYQELYKTENRTAALSSYFAGIAVIISCLGLFGLSAFIAETRQKEIGIRKVLGASFMNIINLVSTDLTKQVSLGIIIAMPISYLIMGNWLESFAYRISLNIWIFIVAGGLAIFTAIISMATQTIKASRINPVECLKNE